MTLALDAVWRQRSVLWMLVRRDLAVKYQSSVLGYLWSLIDPLMQALIYWFIFGVLYHTTLSEGGAGYPLYIVSGFFAWMWFTTGMGESTHALTSQARLITTLRVRREIFPLAKVIARMAEFWAGVPVVFVFALIFNGQFTWRLLMIPVSVGIEFILLTGVSLFLAPLNVLYRDVERVTRLVTRILMYSAPVIYPLQRVLHAGMPHWGKVVYEMNPLVGIIELQHGAWIPGLMPTPRVVIASLAGSLIVFIFGWWVFRKAESAVLKEL